MNELESKLICNLVIKYVSINYSLPDIEKGDTYEHIIQKFYRSLNKLFDLNDEQQMLLQSYVGLLQTSEPNNVDLFDAICDFWFRQTINETILEYLLSKYKETVSRLSPMAKAWIQTRFDDRFLSSLKTYQTLLCIQLYTPQDIKPFDSFNLLNLSLCSIPDFFLIEENPYRDFACLHFFSERELYEGHKETKKQVDTLEMTIDEYYHSLSSKKKKVIYEEMREKDKDANITVLFNLDLFGKLFGFPRKISFSFRSITLDCFHPLLDKIIDSKCIIEFSPDKIITELTAINFGYNLAYHKLKKCPNLEKLPIKRPRGFFQSLQAKVGSLFEKSVSGRDLYTAYNFIIKTIADLFADELRRTLV
jgi:hypothetical protein